MNDPSKIAMLGAKSEGEAIWQSVLPIERDGEKWTVNKSKATKLAGGLVVIFACFQLLSNNKGSGEKPGVYLKGSTELVSHEIPEAMDGDATGVAATINNAPKLKLLGATVITRPIDLSKTPIGSVFDARLVSGASNGLVRAEATSALRAGGETLIPKGAVLIGNGSSSDERLFIQFNQVVFRDGSVGSISAHACDMSDKIVGLKGSKVGTRALNIAGSIGLGFLGGFSEGLQEADGQQGVVVRRPSVKNALLNATAITALEQSKNLMSDLKDHAPLIEVASGTPICIIVSGGNG